MNKHTYIISLVFCLATITSCDDAHKYKHYIYTDISPVNYQEASPAPEPFPSSGTIEYHDFIIRLEFEHYMTQESHFSAVDYEPICDDPISSIQITSTNDYKASKPAGTSLSEYFVYYRGPGNEYALDELWIKNFSFEEYYDHPFPVTFDMYLNVQPSEVSDHRFIVEVSTNSGETWVDTTELITISY